MDATMKILVANLGSTSFKYRLYDMADERQLARRVESRYRLARERCFVDIGGTTARVDDAGADHAVAVRACLDQLTDPTAVV